MSVFFIALIAISSAPAQQSVCPAAPGSGSVVVRDSAGIRIVENRAAPGGAPFLTVVQPPTLALGGPGSSAGFTGLTTATRLSNGQILAATWAGEASLFDSNGRFLGRFGVPGSGPGQYGLITSIVHLPGDSLLASDSPQRKLNVLMQDGRVIRTLEYPFISSRSNPGTAGVSGQSPARVSVLARMMDGSFLLSTIFTMTAGQARTAPPVHGRTLIVMRFDASAGRIDTVARAALPPSFHRPDAPVVELPFASFGSVAAAADGFYLALGERNEIVKHDAEGAVSDVIRMCAPSSPVARVDIDRWRAAYVATARPEYRPVFEETARVMPYPGVKPAITQLVVDAQGRLWARGFAHEGDAPVWNVFAPTGAYQGSVTVPAGIRVFEIGTDYLMGFVDSPYGTIGLRSFALRN